MEGLLPSHAYCIAKAFFRTGTVYLPPHDEEFNFENFQLFQQQFLGSLESS